MGHKSAKREWGQWQGECGGGFSGGQAVIGGGTTGGQVMTGGQ